MIFNMSGGGTGLNFKVIAYATEEALLAAAPAENTIGVITAAPITGWTFSHDEPAEAEEGMVWICVARYAEESSTPFNALKKNCIMMYPVSAQQYLNGEWCDTDTRIFQNGIWSSFSTEVLYLLKDGNQYIDITGGWSGIASDAIVLSKSVDSTPSGAGVPGYVSTQTINKIDVTNFNLISAQVDSLDKNMSIQLVGDSGVVGSGDTLTGAGVVTMDLQNVTGEYYIKFAVDGSYTTNHATASFTISEVKLER